MCATVATCLAGRLGIVDDDIVQVGNLHRQVAHTEQRLGESKAKSLCTTIAANNSNVIVVPHVLRLNSTNALALVLEYDVVIDCSDNPGTRYIINDACVIAKRPLVSAAAVGTYGQLTVFEWQGSPCYRCLHPQPPVGVTSCADAGVLGPVTGVMGSLAALEALKIISRLSSASHRRPRARSLGEDKFDADECKRGNSALPSLKSDDDATRDPRPEVVKSDTTASGFGEVLAGRCVAPRLEFQQSYGRMEFY